jgi:hypothetical protein
MKENGERESDRKEAEMISSFEGGWKTKDHVRISG